MRARLPICMLFLVLLATACGGGGGGGSGSQTFFLIAATTPAPLELGVQRDAIVTVTFNKKLDPSTVTATSLVVVSESTGATIAGVSALVSDGTDLRVSWTGSVLLDADAVFACNLDAGLRSVDAELLGPPVSFRFGTANHDPGVDIPLPADLSNTGALVLGRQAHTATLLQDGRVLVCGGYASGEVVTDTAEIWNPVTGVFTSLPNRMTLPRAGHTATRLPDGTVLITGGYHSQPPLGELGTTATAEIFDPSSTAFTSTGNMTTERGDHAAVLLADGRVLLTGGGVLSAGFITDLATAETFSGGSFAAHPSPMVHTRFAHGIARNNFGKVLLGGGSDVDKSHSFFSEADDEFQDLGEAAGDQVRFGSVVESFASGHFIIAGGDLPGTVLRVDRLSGFVQNTGSGLSSPRAYAASARLGNDRIVVIGGLDFNRGNFIQGTMDVIVEGGVVGARTFATSVTFSPALVFHTATRLVDGSVLICGGANENGAQLNHRNAYVLAP